MNITLFSNNPQLCQCWEEDFKNEENVEVKCIDYNELEPHDCIVSPANSYGIMSGGLDLLIRNELGVRAQDHIQWHINSKFNGCQPVGTCIIKQVNGERFTFLAHAPTMQRPKDINGTMNALSSFYAVLIETGNHPHIDSIACSGMGAGSGKLPPEEVSWQMYQAYEKYKRDMIYLCIEQPQ